MTESIVSVTESNVSVTESIVSVTESNPVDKLQYASARSTNTFDANPCSAAGGMFGNKLKCFIRAVLFVARPIGTELVKNSRVK